jgi:hypothetical protein
VTIVHLPWYGNLWDELYVGPEVVTACGDEEAVSSPALAAEVAKFAADAGPSGACP